MNRSQVKKLTRLIYTETNGQAKELENIFQVLRKDGSANALAILQSLEKMILKNEKQSQLYIESAFELDKGTTSKIKTDFEKLLGKQLEANVKEDKNLIGGLKVRNGDFVWEDSVLSNLEQLKGVINQ